MSLKSFLGLGGSSASLEQGWPPHGSRVLASGPILPCRLWVKAAAGSNAVVCTETKTFELQLVETSNTLLLAQLGAAGDDDDDDDLSGDESAAAGGAARVGRDIEVVGLCGSSFEAKPTPPRLELLHSLLQRSMLTVEDANEDAAAGEDDADGGTFSPRKRGRGADVATGAPAPPAGAPVSPPKTPSSKSASAAAASAVKGADDGAAATPAGKAALAETRTLNRATHFTLRDLEACVQASRAEILVELSALGVVRRKGERGRMAPAATRACSRAVCGRAKVEPPAISCARLPLVAELVAVSRRLRATHLSGAASCRHRGSSGRHRRKRNAAALGAAVLRCSVCWRPLPRIRSPVRACKAGPRAPDAGRQVVRVGSPRGALLGQAAPGPRSPASGWQSRSETRLMQSRAALRAGSPWPWHARLAALRVIERLNGAHVDSCACS